MRRLLAVTLVLSLGVAGLVQAKDKPNAAGAWKWSMTRNGETRETTLTLKMEGNKLTGTVTGRNGETPIQDAKCADGTVSFTVVREINGQKMATKYTGKISGDTIKGKRESERNGQTQSRDWEAKRVVAADPTGTWKWTVNFGNQSREMTLKLKCEGGKLTGCMVREGQETPISEAKCKDGEVSFTLVRERNGAKMTFKYSGKVNADAIKGKVEFQRDGQSQSRDWEAKKG